MYKHLLIATDGSVLAQKAVEHGLALAKTLNAKATAVTVTEPWQAVIAGEGAMVFPTDQYEASAAVAAEKILASVKEAAAAAGTDCDFVHVRDRYPAEGIVETAAQKGCDLIVMSSHGRRGLSRLLMGSQASEVVANSKVPVLICR
jgi:nucleotide-binding universal stress UspA family protein